MSTYTRIIYHIIFSTKNRECSLSREMRPDLYRYIWGIIKNKNGHLYRIGGTDDHIHILTSLHPTVCLADFVKTIKTAASKWIKEDKVFPRFDYWQEGYGAFTLSTDEKDAAVEYIKNQEEHHKKMTFLDEFRELLQEAGIEFDERFVV